MEKWKKVEGFENYEISSFGRLRHNGKIYKEIPNSRGYVYYDLYLDGKRYVRPAHRLVAQNFIPNPNNLQEVNHINEITTDNRVENLEWVTHFQNVMHGTRNKRIASALSKPVLQIRNGVVIKRYSSTKEAERDGYNHTSIIFCCRGEYSHHKGFQWKYEDDYDI